jgi:hypothetical protein
VGGAHPAGCDPFARKRPEKLTKAQKYRLNIPALGLRRVVSSGYLSLPFPLRRTIKLTNNNRFKMPPDAQLTNNNRFKNAPRCALISQDCGYELTRGLVRQLRAATASLGAANSTKFSTSFVGICRDFVSG